MLYSELALTDGAPTQERNCVGYLRHLCVPESELECAVCLADLMTPLTTQITLNLLCTFGKITLKSPATLNLLYHIKRLN